MQDRHADTLSIMATMLPRGRIGASVRRASPALDRDLVAGLYAGRRDSFERLYEEYRARIFNLALRIVQSYEDARDITQEVFIKAYRQLPGLDADMEIKPWLYRVAVNACYDHLRSRKMHRDIDEVENLTRAVRIDTFEQAELSHQLEQTLAGLSERHRTVLILKDIHGLRHDEIASVLGVSRGATQTLLFRAREAFRRGYAELAREHPAGDCHLARQATVAAVGGELPADERRKIMDHARYCPECRETVKSWGAAAVGLGMFLHAAPLPAALQSPLALGAAGSCTGAGAAGATGAGTGAVGGGSAGLSAAAGGVVAKIGGIAAVKIAVVAAAATCAVSAAGVTAYRISDARQHGTAHAGSVALVQRSSGAGAAAIVGSGKTPAAAMTQRQAAGKATAPGQVKKAKTAADGKSKGKPDKPRASAHRGKAADKMGKSNNGHAKSNAATSKVKPTRPAKPSKPDKPGKPGKPDKPGKPGKPDKPGKP